MTNQEIQKQLFVLQDAEYQKFQCKLMPTVNPKNVIGVRTPILRDFAKEIAKNGKYKDFLNSLPHQYYEENNLHAFLIEKIKDYQTCINALNEFLPYVDNWATCDSMKPKVLGKHLENLYSQIIIWMNSDKTYTIRFGIEMLMNFFLDNNFKTKHLELVAKIRSNEYYVNMMIAWYFATALAKQYESTISILEKQNLSVWCHNKTIQKAIESYRIPKEQKEYLRSLKIR